MPKRVVITGLGIISAAGQDKAAFWNNIVQGNSGITAIERFDASPFPARIAAQVHDFKAEDYILRKEARRMDLFVQYACAAARMAVEDAQLQPEHLKTETTGVWVGSGIGGVETFEKQHQTLLEKGPGLVSPFFIPMFIPNMAAGQVAIMLGSKGPNGCTVTACATSSNSIGEAFETVKHGRAKIMITGGAEASITPMSIAGFCSMKALSTLNDNPEGSCRPFALDRQGFVMGEGSGIIVLEELEHALERGAHIYAELAGYGASADASHMVQPDEEGCGAALAFKMALDEAGIEPEQVDYINAHGTGTKLNDLVETRAIKAVFGDHSQKLCISSTKPITGHMLGAAGAVELIASVLAINNGIIPPTINLENPDPECNLDYVPGQARDKKAEVILSDSLGFGGHNAALIARRFHS